MKKKILVVDDEASLTRLIKANLERTGKYEVMTENQGGKAIEVARQFKPDLIFLDVMMPGMGGDEVAALIEEDPQLSNTKYVFLTAIVRREETDPTGSMIGGHLFLAKPVRTEQLVATIEKILGP
ncbi:MAG: response regulator [Candidatus Methylumidiphilus sp.]|nr:response regulator [Pseudomonadota bacterium]